VRQKYWVFREIQSLFSINFGSMGNLNLFQINWNISKKLSFWTNLECSKTFKIVISKRDTREDVGILNIAKISCLRMMKGRDSWVSTSDRSENWKDHWITLNCIFKYLFEQIALERDDVERFSTMIFLEIALIVRWCLAVVWEEIKEFPNYILSDSYLHLILEWLTHSTQDPWRSIWIPSRIDVMWCESQLFWILS
jgi:hypothetical protein